MKSEVVRVLLLRLRELERRAEKQRAKIEEVAPIKEFIELQQRGFDYIQANKSDGPPSPEFMAEVRKLAAEERSLKAKITEINSRNYSEQSKHLLATESKIREIRNELFILGVREDIKSGRF